MHLIREYPEFLVGVMHYIDYVVKNILFGCGAYQSFPES
jgi:hypothetical protein